MPTPYALGDMEDNTLHKPEDGSSLHGALAQSAALHSYCGTVSTYTGTTTITNVPNRCRTLLYVVVAVVTLTYTIYHLGTATIVLTSSPAVRYTGARIPRAPTDYVVCRHRCTGSTMVHTVEYSRPIAEEQAERGACQVGHAGVQKGTAESAATSRQIQVTTSATCNSSTSVKQKAFAPSEDVRTNPITASAAMPRVGEADKDAEAYASRDNTRVLRFHRLCTQCRAYLHAMPSTLLIDVGRDVAQASEDDAAVVCSHPHLLVHSVVRPSDTPNVSRRNGTLDLYEQVCERVLRERIVALWQACRVHALLSRSTAVNGGGVMRRAYAEAMVRRNEDVVAGESRRWPAGRRSALRLDSSGVCDLDVLAKEVFDEVQRRLGAEAIVCSYSLRWVDVQ